MRHNFLVILVLFCWQLALAQDAAPPTDAPNEGAQMADETVGEPASVNSGLTYQNYTAEGFKLSIPIPTNGKLQIPSDLGWIQEPEVAFVWYGEDNDPVSMIELRADNIGTEISPEQYADFYDKLVSEWEGQPKQFKVLRSRTEPYHFGEMDWLIIEVEDNSAASANTSANPNLQGMFVQGEDAAEGTETPSETVYYTIFTTYHAETIYTIGFYYLQPVSDAVQTLAVPMLRGFSLTAK